MGLALVAHGAWRLLAPVPPPSDVPGFAFAGAGLLMLGLALALRSAARAEGLDAPGRARAWRTLHYLAGAYVGVAIAVLFLAHKDDTAADWRAMLGPAGALDVLLHVLIAPFELALGALVGFADPEAPLYALACVAAGLLGVRLLRRRLWPRQGEVGQAAVAEAAPR